MLGQDELRILNEIAHKLDYAIRTVESAPVAPLEAPNGAQLEPETMRVLHALMLPQPAESLHERIMDLAVGVTGAERGFLMLIEEGRKLRFKVGRSLDQQTIRKEAEYSRSIIKQVVQTAEPVLIADTTSGTDSTSSSLRGLKMRSIMCVPMMFGGQGGGQAQAGGIIYLDSRALVRKFDPNSLELASSVAQLATTAIENAAQINKARRALGQDAEKLHENFDRLLDVGRTVSSTLVLEDLLELVIEKVLEVTRADRGFLMLIDEGNPEPVFRIGLTWNKKDGPARRKRKLSEAQFFFSRTVCRKALEQRSSVVLKDVQAGGGEDPSVSMVQMDLHSVMVTPLIEKGNVLGLIYVDSKMSNREFADSDLELFEALAGQAAIGLKNALLYSQVAAQQRIESEIAIASQMQEDLCPKQVPPINGIELTGYMTPAREVGGDYYDYIEDAQAKGQQLGIVVGDVSGKGLGAGMVAVMARCFLRPMMSAYGMDDPSQLLKYLNHMLTGELKPGTFMTMLLMVWDARRGVARYASSGHENIILWKATSRSAKAIASGGSPLGLSTTTGGPTPNAELALQAGDTAVLYTDGVTEAMNTKDEEFTLERLLALVNQVGGQSPQQIQEAIMSAVIAHRGEREQTDDITLVILRRV